MTVTLADLADLSLDLAKVLPNYEAIASQQRKPVGVELPYC